MALILFFKMTTEKSLRIQLRTKIIYPRTSRQHKKYNAVQYANKRYSFIIYICHLSIYWMAYVYNHISPQSLYRENGIRKGKQFNWGKNSRKYVNFKIICKFSIFNYIAIVSPIPSRYTLKFGSIPAGKILNMNW